MADPAPKFGFPIPPPNFNSVITESAISKPNPWLQVLQERSHIFGTKRHKFDYDQPREENYWFHQNQNDFYENQNEKESSGPGDRYGRQHNTMGQKTDKRDVESFAYFCDACDRAFKTDDQYEVHNSQHEKCRVKDCNYIAAPKLVKLHYNMQHVTGLATKIKESSVDVEKWREERRRNFPTSANIRKKEQELRERVERGEVLENKQFGKMRGRGRGRGQRGNRGHRGRGGWDQRNGRYNNQYSDNTLSGDHSTDPLSRLDMDGSSNHGFAGSSRIPPHIVHNERIGAQCAPTPPSTVSPVTSSTAPTKPDEPKSAGLSFLISSYGDVISSDEEEGEIKEPPQKKRVNEVLKLESADISHQQQANSAVALKSTTVSKQDTAVTYSSRLEGEAQRGGKHRNRPRKNNNNTIKSQQNQQQKSVTQCRSSLLEKLLASEIRHERNVLLQCVRHVVRNEFFGMGAKKVETTTTTAYVDDDTWE